MSRESLSLDSSRLARIFYQLSGDGSPGIAPLAFSRRQNARRSGRVQRRFLPSRKPGMVRPGISRRRIMQASPGPAGAPVTLCVALVMSLFMPAAWSAQDSDPNPHTRALIDQLDSQQKAGLRGALRQSVIRARSGDRLEQIPAHQVYHTIFLDLLLEPAAMVGLPAADRALIDALPAHDDQRFAPHFDQALTDACRVVDRLPPGSPAAAVQVVRAYRQANRQISARLDRHYNDVLNRLSPPGRALVDERVARLVTADSLVHTTLDFEQLSFSEPEFVVAFFKDTCANSERNRQSTRHEAHKLRDQLDADFDRGAVQIYQPQ